MRPLKPLLLPVVGLTVALLALACGGGGPGESAGAVGSQQPSRLEQPSTGSPLGATGEGGLAVELGDLRARLASAPQVKGRSGAFREPDGPALVAFERAFAALAGGDLQAVPELEALGFRVRHFEDTQGGGSYLLVEEVQPRGGGTFVLNLTPARALTLEAPHADSDEGTLAQSISLLTQLGARALLITGANRCAAEAATPCDGKSGMCGGTLRISDAAHYPNNFFTAAHRALLSVAPDDVAVSVHGMDAPGPEGAVLSDGTEEPRPDALSVRVRDSLNALLQGSQRAYSCNAAEDAGAHRALCGTTNVQGRITNGASDGCDEPPPSGSDHFLHLEQSAALRGEKAGLVVQALAQSVPCSLGAQGLGCAEGAAR